MIERLAAVPDGMVVRILEVPDEHADELALEGVRPGAEVAVVTRAPLRGPVVVRIGRARVAISRSLAAAIVVARGERVR